MKAEIPKKYLSRTEALTRMQRYCAYQDRCHQEVRSKLLDLGIYGTDLEEILVELIQENFLNEERFARSFARGKFRIKQWGRTRIKRELALRDVSAYCIRKALEEIDETEYLDCLQNLVSKKSAQLKDDHAFARKTRLANWAIGRGFEPGLVWEVVNQLEPE